MDISEMPEAVSALAAPIVKLADGRRATLRVPASKTSLPSAYAFGIYKAGSTLLSSILQGAADAAKGHVYYSLNDDCFKQGIEIEAPILRLPEETVAVIREIFLRPGTIFGGFRRCPRFELPD